MARAGFLCPARLFDTGPLHAPGAILKEGDEIAKEFKRSQAINATLICAGQKVEHYEIASYGCLIEWAGMLGARSAVRHHAGVH